MHEFSQREVSVVTPEQVRLEYETAGIGSRAGAHLIDWVLLAAFFLIVFSALTQTTTLFAKGFASVAKDYAGGFAIIVFFIVQYGYFTFTEFYMGGQSIGKKWLGIRVIQDNGQALTMLSSLVRNFFRVVDALPLFYSIGLIVSFFHPKDKRIGDLVAGTVVVIDAERDRQKKQKRIERTMNDWNEDLVKLELNETQKASLTRKDWLMLATYMERLPNLSKQTRKEISDQLASHILQKMLLTNGELYQKNSASFLIALYQELRGDWEV